MFTDVAFAKAIDVLVLFKVEKSVFTVQNNAIQKDRKVFSGVAFCF